LDQVTQLFFGRPATHNSDLLMSDAEAKRLANAEYWDGRYAKVGSDGQVHEWFRSFGDLEPFFARHLFQSRGPETAPRILHLGSGDSVLTQFWILNELLKLIVWQTIPQDLVQKGYKNQICVDFSSVVVETMSKRHAEIDGIAWMQADVRQMDQIPSGSINVAFDKGTLDAMIHGSPWDPPDDVRNNTGRYVREVCSKHSPV
jgi:EEF1A lysine methyltransferase 4